MTVLVLGGAGFIGKRAIRKLVDRGESVVCMDINPNAASFSGLEGGSKSSTETSHSSRTWSRRSSPANRTAS